MHLHREKARERRPAAHQAIASLIWTLHGLKRFPRNGCGTLLNPEEEPEPVLISLRIVVARQAAAEGQSGGA